MGLRKRLFIGCMIALVLLPLLGSVALSQTFSTVLSFQGRLSASDGKPLPDGPYAVRFAMYAAASGGIMLWSETQGVTQIGGTFVAYLGVVTPFPSDLLAGGDRWLGIRVGGDPEMANRVRMTPSPWAIRAAKADQATNADLLDAQHGAFYQNAGNLNAGTLSDLRLSSNVALLDKAQTFSANTSFAGNVGIGTSSPSDRLDVAGTVRMTGMMLSTSPVVSYVLKSDALGVGSWQADGLALPYSGTVNSGSPAIYVMNYGAGDTIFAYAGGGGTGLTAQGSSGCLGIVGDDNGQTGIYGYSATAYGVHGVTNSNNAVGRHRLSRRP